MSAFSRLGLACGIALALIGTGSVQAGIIRVHFDQDDYYILPEQTFQVQISYDDEYYDTAGDQPYGAGLFRAGLRVTYDPACVMAPALADIGVVSDLDHSYWLGPGRPALREIDSAAAYARFAGSVEGGPPDYYEGTLLATYTFKDLSVGGSYVLELGRYSPPSSQLWASGIGGMIAEELLDWDNATVHVVPEPGTLVLLTLGGLVLARRYRRT